MTKRTFTGLVTEADKPNINGIVYPEAVLRKAVEKAQARVKERVLFGRKGQSGKPINPFREGWGKGDFEEGVSHVVTDLRMDGKKLMADIELLDTPDGKKVEALLKSGAEAQFRLALMSCSTLSKSEEDVIEQAEVGMIDFVRRDEVE